MRYGIFGDIHGNLEGLQAVLWALADERIDRYLCTGDIVGYGADPNACCQTVRALGATCLLGNHDHACLGAIDVRWFNVHARAAVEWTMAELLPEHRDWLATLDPMRRVEDLVLTHSSLPDPWQWTYITTPELARETLLSCPDPVIVVGHTHVAEAYRMAADQRLEWAGLAQGGELLLDPYCRYLINPGSCGQPRDHNPLAAFAVYDTSQRRVTVKRVAYDVETTAAKIAAAGLPEVLARRLRFGR